MEKILTWADCSAMILASFGHPMHVEKIVSTILAQGLYIPEHNRGDGVDKNTCTQLLFQEIDTKGASNRFVWVDAATFDLRKNYTAEQLAVMDAAMNAYRAPLKRAKDKTEKPNVRQVKPANEKKNSYSSNGFTILRWKA